MPQLSALSLSIAVLGAIWAFLALGPLSGYVLVWAGFIAWGCFFQSGADNNALSKTIVGTSYGALIGWIALLIIVDVPGARARRGVAGDRRRSHGVLPRYRGIDQIVVGSPRQMSTATPRLWAIRCISLRRRRARGGWKI